MATSSIFFGAVGTAGQRCTSTRRIIVHESVADEVRERLLAAYKSVNIGNPLDRKTLMGPLIDQASLESVQRSIERVKSEGGEIPKRGRERLRNRECEYGNERRRDRRCVRRGEEHRRWPRKRQRRVEKLHAPADEHDQLFDGTPAGAGDRVWRAGRRKRDRL